MKNITILGSTGSIGRNTLDVISRHLDKYTVMALTANTNVETMCEQVRCYKPRFAVMHDTQAAQQLETRLQPLGLDTIVLGGAEALETVAAHPETDVVMAAIVGAVGLLPTLKAALAGKRLLLANKEALVMSGDLFMDAVLKGGAELLPIDSEHNAIFQCMPEGFVPGVRQAGVDRVLLTASGGPFRTKTHAELEHVTPDQACAHPNWVMGRKISVDCATLMNKGLEVIEAFWLFNVPLSSIEVVIHPQSVIHSMVGYLDGSVLAQLGNPDMRTPIAHALAWPARIVSGVKPLDILLQGPLDFQPVTAGQFPCLALAYQAAKRGGTATAILNAANEVAVEAFLEKQISFMEIHKIVEGVLEKASIDEARSIEAVLAADHAARQWAHSLVSRC